MGVLILLGGNMNIDYSNYDDKNLVSVYIFSYPDADDDNATKLE